MARLAEYGREDFFKHRFHHHPGEHVTLAGPTGFGKTTTQFQGLEQVANPNHPAIFLAMKPRDETVERWADQLGYKEVGSWPPPYWKQKLFNPSGWILKPPLSFNPDVDNFRQFIQFRRAILHSYRKGNRIIVADELYGLADELGLRRELIAVWSRGRAMGTSIWGGVQKPTHVPLWAYNQAGHMFLGNDPDMNNVKRFSEFGGVDPRIILETVPNLGEHDMLYLRRRGKVACIVRA